jgi:hypothetical protein
MTQPNLFDARAARDAGIEKIRSKNTEWLERALKMLPGMKTVCMITTGEGIRVWLTGQGLEAPSNQHAWGMLVRTAMKRGLIKDTGRMGQMFTEKSHARRTPLWEIA